jgi:hypothetical protein
MSLIRKETTEAMAAANRANSQTSTGPLTPAGKLQARMNALQHGMWASSGQVMPQLGETEEELLELRAELQRQFYPNGPRETGLVELMVENRWRRRRLLRAEKTMLVKNQLEFDIDQERALAAEGCSRDSAGEAGLAQESGLVSLPDSTQKFHFILQCLHAARRMAESEGFCDAGLKRLEAVFGPKPSLRGARLLASYRGCQKGAPDSSSPAQPAERASHTDFQALLDSEISSFQTLLELHETSRGVLAAATRETLVVLPADQQKRILTYEELLDRQNERYIKQLEQHKQRKAAARERDRRRAELTRQLARQKPFQKHTHHEKPDKPSGEANGNAESNSAESPEGHHPTEKK